MWFCIIKVIVIPPRPATVRGADCYMLWPVTLSCHPFVILLNGLTATCSREGSVAPHTIFIVTRKQFQC